MTKSGGLFAEVLTNRRFAGGRTVALIKEQIKHLMHAVEPARQLVGSGRLERDLIFDQVSSGPLEPFLHRLFLDQESAGNFRRAKAAERLEGERQLVLAGEPRVTAGEHHFELAVLDLAVEEKIVELAFAWRWLGGQFFDRPATDLAATQGIEDFVLSDAMKPRGRILGDLNAPGLERIQERRLHHVLD